MQDEVVNRREVRRTWMRSVGVGVLAGAAVLTATVLLGGDEGHDYNLLFETGGQLVPGNQVLVAGHAIGSVEEISLTDDGQARVAIHTEDPLHVGTTAVVRATSLSGVANRYVSIAPGPNSEPELEDGATIASTQTTSPVDLDQLFNTFDRSTRRGLADFIQGQATVYRGNSKQANRAYKYLAPGMQSTERLLAELTQDQATFSQFLVNGSRVLGAAAERSDDLSALTENGREALGAIAGENRAFDRSLRSLPPTLRQANTTFVNLRAALDDLDGLVASTKTATPQLAPFLRELDATANEATPVVRDLRHSLDRSGTANDLGDTLSALPGVESRAARAVPVTIQALDDSQPKLAQLRPYTPDLVGLVSGLSQATSNYDGNGHYLRAQATGTNLFEWDAETSVLEPIPASEQFADFDNGFFNRCPGGSTQPLADSNPFLDDGALAGTCDPAATPQGP